MKTSTFKGVTWHEKNRKWRARVVTGGKLYHGGYHESELRAAHIVNLLCDQCGVSRENPDIGDAPFQLCVPNFNMNVQSFFFHEYKMETSFNVGKL